MDKVHEIKKYVEKRLKDAQNHDNYDTEFTVRLILEFINEVEEV